VIDDDPALTARIGDETHHPLRVVLDSTGRTPPGAKVYDRAGKGAMIATTRNAPQARLAAFREIGAEPLVLPGDGNGRPDLSDLMSALLERGVINVLVEGGGEVLGAFFDADLLDEVHLYIAPKIFGGGKPALGGRGVERLYEAERFTFDPPETLGADILLRGVRRMELR
ncbi:MAG: RibD family protein, partial [Hyphococcus sp.]